MRKAIIILIGLMVISGVSVAQDGNLAAAMRVFGPSVIVDHVTATNTIALPPLSVTPFGIGDTVQTQNNGRVVFEFADFGSAILLPQGVFTLHDFRLVGGVPTLDATLEGIMLFEGFDDNANLRLEATDFTLTNAASDFGVWSLANDRATVMVRSGDLQLESGIQLASMEAWLPALQDDPLPMEAPYNPARLVGRELGCEGKIETIGNRRLLIREGTGQGYFAVGAIPNFTTITLTHLNSTSEWVRIQFQSGFGWMQRLAITTDCDLAATFPLEWEEDNANIRNITEFEIPLVEPYFGTVEDNTLFYRS